jgi:hypothetical protein
MGVNNLIGEVAIFKGTYGSERVQIISIFIIGEIVWSAVCREIASMKRISRLLSGACES